MIYGNTQSLFYELFYELILNPKLEFITLMDKFLYEDVKSKVLAMDYWEPNTHYNTFDGLADGIKRKIHLDGSVF